MSEETKAERLQDIQHYVSDTMSDMNDDVLVSYHLTSIYDHSALDAFSKVVQKLVPQLPTLNNLLDMLISSCSIDKSYLVDVVTKLYIATDSNPVDAHSYELCSDLVDVVIDVSYIYGMSPETGVFQPYDEKSTSAIRLTSGMVLYLREVRSNSRFLLREVYICVIIHRLVVIWHWFVYCAMSTLQSVLNWITTSTVLETASRKFWRKVRMKSVIHCQLLKERTCWIVLVDHHK